MTKSNIDQAISAGLVLAGFVMLLDTLTPLLQPDARLMLGCWVVLSGLLLMLRARPEAGARPGHQHAEFHAPHARRR